jgi:hypothetical protein
MGENFFQKIKIHDKIVIYITKISAFAGIFEIILKNPKGNVKWVI